VTGSAWSRQLRKIAAAYGRIVAPTRGGHYRLTHPAAAVPVFVSATPSDWRVPLKVRAELRRRAGKGERVSV
jgi:hypothetical protein